MLKSAEIVLVKNFRLKSGEHKDKLLIVLLSLDNGNKLCLSLTTSKQYIQPEDIKPGCIATEKKHMYHFPAGTIVGNNGFSFRKDTFIMTFNNIIFTSESQFLQLYPAENLQVLDGLTLKYYFDLIYCLYKSPYVERKYKKLLEPVLEGLGNE